MLDDAVDEPGSRDMDKKQNGHWLVMQTMQTRNEDAPAVNITALASIAKMVCEAKKRDCDGRWQMPESGKRVKGGKLEVGSQGEAAQQGTVFGGVEDARSK